MVDIEQMPILKVKRHVYVPIVDVSACGDCFFMWVLTLFYGTRECPSPYVKREDIYNVMMGLHLSVWITMLVREVWILTHETQVNKFFWRLSFVRWNIQIWSTKSEHLNTFWTICWYVCVCENWALNPRPRFCI